jgi:SagB-type dehydrogenase family enzyme
MLAGGVLVAIVMACSSSSPVGPTGPAGAATVPAAQSAGPTAGSAGPTAGSAGPTAGSAGPTTTSSSRPLPSPRTVGDVSLEAALDQRRSVREFLADPLTDEELGQLLWAAQGVTDPAGLRTAPSAGALYPLELYAVTRTAVLRYDPPTHSVETCLTGDHRRELQAAALDQAAVGEAPVTLVISAVVERTAARYGERATRYVQLEAGHAAQNVLLQAVALGLGAVPIGAFSDGRVAALLGLPAGELPLYLIPVGHPR